MSPIDRVIRGATLRGQVRSVRLTESKGIPFARSCSLKSRLRVVLDVDHGGGDVEPVLITCLVGSRRRSFGVPKGYSFGAPVLSLSQQKATFPLVSISLDGMGFITRVHEGDVISVRGSLHERRTAYGEAYRTLYNPVLTTKAWRERSPESLTNVEIKKILDAVDREDPRPLSQRIVHEGDPGEGLGLNLSASNVLILEREFVSGEGVDQDQFEYWGLVNACSSHPTFLDQVVCWSVPIEGPDGIKEMISPNPFGHILEEEDEVSMEAVYMGFDGMVNVLEEDRRVYRVQPIYFTNHFIGRKGN